MKPPSGHPRTVRPAGIGSGGVFFIDPARREETAAAARRLFPEAAAAAVHDADEIRRHVFDLLGSGKTDLGERIDWHRDFKSGLSWDPRRCYEGDDSYLRLHDPSDVKVPWDLSSFLHLPTLGKAYWYTGEEKYAREFADEVSGWIGANPPGRGINWACAMKAAHRLLNWIWGWYFFRKAPAAGGEFRAEFLSSLAIHGDFVLDHLEDRRPANNHYLLSLAALYYLGTACPEAGNPRRRVRFARRRLEEEIRVQVYPDGTSYEGSIYYHRFAAEIFLSALVLGRRAGGAARFRPDYEKRVERMLEFVEHYTRPGGSAPRIGDADDGRVQILADYSSWDRLDHRDLLSTGAAVFSRKDFKKVAGKFSEESFWILGEGGRENYQRLGVGEEDPPSRGFPRGGFYVMRRGDRHLIADCLGADPAAPPGHRHNSRLSFELTAGGVDFIVDPGTFTYSADPVRRNLYRSTGYHNTVTIDRREQNGLRPDRLWSLQPGGRIRMRAWKTGDDYDLLDAEYAYSRRWPLGGRLVHRRQIYFRGGRFWVIRDVLIGRGRHRFVSRLHFAPKIEVVLRSGMIEAAEAGRRLFAVPFGEVSPRDWRLEDTCVSGRYGREEKSLVACRAGVFIGQTIFGMLLSPDRADNAVIAEAEAIYRRMGSNGSR